MLSFKHLRGKLHNYFYGSWSTFPSSRKIDIAKKILSSIKFQSTCSLFIKHKLAGQHEEHIVRKLSIPFPTKCTQSIFCSLFFFLLNKSSTAAKFSGVTFSTDYKNNLGIYHRSTYTHTSHIPFDFGTAWMREDLFSWKLPTLFLTIFLVYSAGRRRR